jgi:hypothetical protein
MRLHKVTYPAEEWSAWSHEWYDIDPHSTDDCRGVTFSADWSGE